VALAKCDWKSIKKQGEYYLYPKECDIEVGKLVLKEKERKAQVKKLNETIKLKDLALNEADKRIDLWRDTTYKMEDRILKQKTYNKYTNWAYYGLGVLSVVLGGYAIGQAAK
jgi:hypothetical protein